MKNWVSLHTHTTFSMLDGYGKIEDYVKRAKEISMGALATTDHGNIHSWLDFYDTAKEYGIKPILGLEAYQARKTRFDRDDEERAAGAKNEWEQKGPYHITLLAKDLAGYHNIMKLSSSSFTEGLYVKPRIDHELIAQHSEGLIVLSGCLGSEVQQALLRDDYAFALSAAAKMQEIVGKENYFIEIQDHGLEEQHAVQERLLQIAREIDAKVVCTNDCHYVNRVDAHNHDVMLCSQTGSRIDEENRFKFTGDAFYLKSYEEMAKTFEEEWLKTSCEIADMVDIQLEFGEYHFPKYPDLPKEKTTSEFLEEQVWEGLEKRFGLPLPQEVVDRAEYELSVIKEENFEEYFLVVGDLVRWAKDNGIRMGPGRGSAAGVLVAYALRITELDPIKYGLLFERFLIKGRKSPPDIDLDIDDRYRQDLINYTREKYGHENTAHITTFSKVGAKSAIRDATKALGYEFSVGNKLSDLVPAPVLGVSKTLSEAMESSGFKKEYDTNPDSRKIIDAAIGLEGIYRQPGVHAAGIVIADRPISDYVPVMLAGKKKDTLVTQWPMDRVEQCGLLKIDFLGLRNLGIIDSAVKYIKERTGEDVDIDSIDLEDKEVYDLMSRGDVKGLFQIESDGFRDMTVAVQPSRLEDVMAILALYRPGPMGSGIDKTYIKRKHGRQSVSYPHPALKEHLENTYGLMIYQENVLNVTKAITGWDAGQADDLRKDIGKKKLDKIKLHRKQFVDDGKKYLGINETLSNKIYSDIEYFAGYGFNAAHACSYALVCYQTAWLKTHFPVEYMAALMTSVSDTKDRLASYMNECKRMGIYVHPPSIRDSGKEFKILDDNNIIFGLQAVEGLGDATITSILKTPNRVNWKTLWSFFSECEENVLNKGTIEHLLRSGSLDCLVDQELEANREERLDLLSKEKKELGIYVSGHPLEELSDLIAGKFTHTIDQLEYVGPNAKVKLAGTLEALKSKTTKRGSRMGWGAIEDMTGQINVVMFPKFYEANEEAINSPNLIGIFTGRVAREGDDDNSIIKFIPEAIEVINTDDVRGHKPIILNLDKEPTEEMLLAIQEIINARPGDSKVYMNFVKDDFKYSIVYNNMVTPLAQKQILDRVGTV